MSASTSRPLKPIWHFLPSGWSLPFLILGASWILMLGSCSGAVAVSGIASGKPAGEELTSLALLLGFGVVPVGALLLFIGTLVAGRWAARASLVLVTLVVTVFGFLALLVSELGGTDFAGGALFATLMYSVPTCILVLALVISAAMAAREVRQSVAEQRKLRVVELLEVRGQCSFETLGEDLRLSLTAIPGFLRGLLNQQLHAVVDEETQMIFSPQRYARKERDLVSVSYGRGRVGLDELSKELRLSESRIKELLVAAMNRGVFAGYVDWRSRQVVSAAASSLRRHHTCPSCGGEMNLAGRGLIVCPYCTAEVFMS